jgi:hypothetical protein
MTTAKEKICIRCKKLCYGYLCKQCYKTKKTHKYNMTNFRKVKTLGEKYPELVELMKEKIMSNNDGRIRTKVK